MLNLQAANQRTLQLDRDQPNPHVGLKRSDGGGMSSCTTSSVVFERVVGSLGNSVIDTLTNEA